MLFWFCSVGAWSGAAQLDSTMLNKDFQFEDGVYRSLSDFQLNQPTYAWSELDAQLVANPNNFSAVAAYIHTPSGDALSATEVWGISVDGLPYVRLAQEEIDAGDGVMRFAGLKVRGRLCLFAYTTEETKWVEIAAYNPLTGRPFRKGKVSQEVTVKHQYLLELATGIVAPFNRESLLGFIREDEQLSRTVRQLSDEEVSEKLYKCLLIYDDRNPIYLPVKGT